MQGLYATEQVYDSPLPDRCPTGKLFSEGEEAKWKSIGWSHESFAKTAFRMS